MLAQEATLVLCTPTAMKIAFDGSKVPSMKYVVQCNVSFNVS